jgi:hypothetical protein
MSHAELEERAIAELSGEMERRLELEARNLESARFEFTKLQIRVKLFGEDSLDQKEREAFAQSHPEHIAQHEAGLARLQEQLDKLRAYADRCDSRFTKGGPTQVALPASLRSVAQAEG